MVSCVYVEKSVRNHQRTREILRRHQQATVVEIEHQGEVFNPRAQNFRLQKANPALIIASKRQRLILPTPQGYGLEGRHNYYFSHMLNCLYDCRYCFLQGMYPSAHQVIFVNYEDFANDIIDLVQQHANQAVWFFSGYDCDSLAYEPVTGFAEYFVPLIANTENAWLELRTKSTQIRQLLKQAPCDRIITAFSFTDAHSHQKLEHGVPTITRRILAMKTLREAGWPIGLRFDPLVYHDNYRQGFIELLEQIFNAIEPDEFHSVSLGAFRLPKNNFRQITRLYPEQALFAQNLELNNGMMSYPLDQEQRMISDCENELMKYIKPDIYHACEWYE